MGAPGRSQGVSPWTIGASAPSASVSPGRATEALESRECLSPRRGSDERRGTDSQHAHRHQRRQRLRVGPRPARGRQPRRHHRGRVMGTLLDRRCTMIAPDSASIMAMTTTPRKREPGTLPKESKKFDATSSPHPVIIWSVYSCALDPGDSENSSMTYQTDRKNRRNEARPQSWYRGWMKMAPTHETDETKPPATPDPRNFDETKPRGPADKRDFDKTKPLATLEPCEIDETKPKMRSIGKICRLIRLDRNTRISWITRIGESGRFRGLDGRSETDLAERALMDPCAPGFLNHEFSARPVAQSDRQSVVQSRLPGESLLLNNCHASVWATGMSNIGMDAFLPAQPVPACEGCLGRARLRTTRGIERHAANVFHPPPRPEMDTADDSRRNE
jgi:hypothetical protein